MSHFSFLMSKIKSNPKYSTHWTSCYKWHVTCVKLVAYAISCWLFQCLIYANDKTRFLTHSSLTECLLLSILTVHLQRQEGQHWLSQLGEQNSLPLSNTVSREATNPSPGLWIQYVCFDFWQLSPLSFWQFPLHPSFSIQSKTMSSCSHDGLNVSLLLHS